MDCEWDIWSAWTRTSEEMDGTLNIGQYIVGGALKTRYSCKNPIYIATKT